MLLYVKQNIFESPAQVLVNAVNTVGVMGKGIAKTYKQMYPEMYKQYRYYCENSMLDIGKLWLYKDDTKWILNFPTKEHWRNPSEIEYIEEGLKKFVDTYEDKEIDSISFPQLGTGNGGLDWEKEVKPLFEKYLRPLPIDIFIHVVDSKSSYREHNNISETKKWLQNDPTALSVDYVWEDLLQKLEAKEWKINGWEFQIDNLSSDEELTITSGSDSFIFYKEDLFDLWIKLRNYGYLVTKDFPEGYRENKAGAFILRLLSILPYIQPIEVLDQSNRYVGLSVRKVGLPESEKLTKGTSTQMELLFK